MLDQKENQLEDEELEKELAFDQITFEAQEEDEGERLDKYLSRKISEVSRSRISDWIKNGLVEVNGKTNTKPSHALRFKQKITCFPPKPPALLLEAQDIAFDVVYENDAVIVVDKPAGLVVHPGAGQPDKTLVNGLLKFHQLSHIGLPTRPGIVHRIDKDTSGLLVIAKNDATHYHLANQLSRHEMGRQYLALVWGSVKQQKGTISSFYGRDINHRIKFTGQLNQGKRAVTHWQVLEDFGVCTLLSVQLETGRTHQIRVHMSESNHPLVGDLLYGQKRKIVNPQKYNRLQALGWDLGLQRHALHAASLSFQQLDGSTLSFESPLPQDLQALLDILRAECAQA